ncbi:hypothetical protein ACPXCE_16830 [Streptomyces sp. DT24]|uniref:hypothetical protein n=1 Tax=unclassified Streptomyces TaxID=2593676 RepID=UPI0023B97B2D|nr:hypothetical protein [Streptomyces sp. AM 4-1-1]WEH35325.1 hypothetical protein PZB75_19350 [Streptomyces sp. AM 4-1-1]
MTRRSVRNTVLAALGATALTLVVGAVLAQYAGPDGFRTYADGYRYGSGTPRIHLSGGDAVSRAAAEAECGEHAETDGAPLDELSDAWWDGCTDGARGLPKR